MPRYIDADKLKKDILALRDCDNGFSGTYDKACIIDIIDEQPTADVVEVVRCKDCVWRDIDPIDAFTTGCRWYQEESPDERD